MLAGMAEIAMFDHDAVLAAVTPVEAIERVRDGFVRYASGEWTMPPKVYLEAPPNGDFRAMPARGSGSRSSSGSRRSPETRVGGYRWSWG